jgi:hypothetical protein
LFWLPCCPPGGRADSCSCWPPAAQTKWLLPPTP